MGSIRTLSSRVLVLVVLTMGCGSTGVWIEQVEKARVPLPGIHRIGVMDFADAEKSPGSGRAAASTLVSQLHGERYFELVERSQIMKVMDEQAFSLTGAVDEQTAATVGQILGVQAIVVGDVMAYNVEERSEKKKEKRKVKTEEKEEEEEVEILYRRKSGTVAINYRVVEVETGKVIVAETKKATYYRQIEEGAWSEVDKVISFLSVLTGRSGGLPDGSVILANLLEDVTAQFAATISPHRVRRRKILEESENEYTRKGVKLAQKGLWSDAMVAWKKAIEVAPADGAAHNNLGIAYERAGMYEKAREEYEAAVRLDPDQVRYRKNLAHLGRIHDIGSIGLRKKNLKNR